MFGSEALQISEAVQHATAQVFGELAAAWERRQQELNDRIVQETLGRTETLEWSQVGCFCLFFSPFLFIYIYIYMYIMFLFGVFVAILAVCCLLFVHCVFFCLNMFAVPIIFLVLGAAQNTQFFCYRAKGCKVGAARNG